MKNSEQILDHILESDVIVVDDYYFVEIDYDSVMDTLWLRNGHCISQKKNKKSFRFDNNSIDGAEISGNVVSMFSTKGNLVKLELMSLMESNIS